MNWWAIPSIAKKVTYFLMISSVKYNLLLRMNVYAIAIIALSGCVSSTLETSQFKPVGSTNSVVTQSENQSAALSDDPVALTEQTQTTSAASADSAIDPNAVNPAAREQAVEEMRAKAEQTSGEKTHIGALPETAAKQLTPRQQQTKSAELKAAVAQAQSSVSDAEVQSKQSSIQRLRQKAKSHYQDAVKRIEN